MKTETDTFYLRIPFSIYLFFIFIITTQDTKTIQLQKYSNVCSNLQKMNVNCD